MKPPSSAACWKNRKPRPSPACQALRKFPRLAISSAATRIPTVTPNFSFWSHRVAYAFHSARTKLSTQGAANPADVAPEGVLLRPPLSPNQNPRQCRPQPSNRDNLRLLSLHPHQIRHSLRR